MSDSEFHAEIDELVKEVEEEIEQTAEFIDGLPDFPPRSDRAVKLENVLNGNG